MLKNCSIFWSFPFFVFFVILYHLIKWPTKRSKVMSLKRREWLSVVSLMETEWRKAFSCAWALLVQIDGMRIPSSPAIRSIDRLHKDSASSNTLKNSKDLYRALNNWYLHFLNLQPGPISSSFVCLNIRFFVIFNLWNKLPTCTLQLVKTTLIHNNKWRNVNIIWMKNIT